MTEHQEDIRVVVTGIGAITAQGASAQMLWDGVREGRCAIRPVQNIPMEGIRTRLGGEVQQVVLPEHEYPHPPDQREPAIDFALKAAEEAVEHCGALASVPHERVGVVMGTCNAGLVSSERWYAARLRGEPGDPRLLQLSTPQALAEAVAGAFEARGPVLSIDTACAAGANALGYAAEFIRSGQADAMLAGGSEAFTDIIFAGFNSLQSLSPLPAAPYSSTRQGLSLGEGSGMVVLMREDLARRLGTPVLAEVLGYALSADGYHPTAPHPEGKGAARSIRAALAKAGVSPEQVAYVNSHGTGTPKNDPAETKATKLGLGDAVYQTSVSSTKSMIGHLLGAAGAVEGIVTIKAVQEQIAPPTANYEGRDPECDLDYVPNVARPLAIDVAISNNFAFGGANATLVLARPDAIATPLPRPARDRTVITGMAALTSAGTTVEALWEAFRNRRATTRRENGVCIGRVDFDPSLYLSPRERRRMDRIIVFGVVDAKMALKDAGLEVTEENGGRVGVIFGTGIGPMESMEEFTRPLLEEGPAAASPAVFPNSVYNAAGGQVGMLVGAVGPASTATAGHAAGSSALCYARDLVAENQADAVLCIAGDTLTDAEIAAYRDLGLLRPDGAFALAEAGVALTVERLSHARERGTRIYGEVLGYGITSDGKGIGRIDLRGSGFERAMRLALERSGLGPQDIGAIWANAMGHEPTDRAEMHAIERVFGEKAAVLRPKLLCGEPIGAGGVFNAILALRSFAEDTNPAPAMINSSSCGGTHISVVVAPYAP